MATLSELRTRIARKLADGNLVDPTSAEIDAQINSTIDYYETDKFWFSEDRASITLTVGSAVVPDIPSDFKQIIEPNGVVVLENQVRYPLIHLTPLEYDTINVDGIGLPRGYTYRDGQFLLWYYPDQAYTLFLFYRKTYADLVNDSDSNDFTTHAERLIEYKTLANLSMDYRFDPARAERYERQSLDEFNKIKRETYNRTATGSLLTENIVDRSSTEYYTY